MEIVSNKNSKEQATFLADLLFKRKYIKQGIKLDGKYWRDARYQKEFQFYIIKARALLKSYSFIVLSNVFNSKKGQSVWSFNCSWMIPEFEKEKIRLENLEELNKNKQKIEKIYAYTFSF
jgi:hypothetical protein